MSQTVGSITVAAHAGREPPLHAMVGGAAATDDEVGRQCGTGRLHGQLYSNEPSPLVRVRKSDGECIAVLGGLASLTGVHDMLLG